MAETAEKQKKVALKFVGGTYRKHDSKEQYGEGEGPSVTNRFRGMDSDGTVLLANKGETIRVTEDHADALMEDHPDWFEKGGSKAAEKEDDDSGKKSKK